MPEFEKIFDKISIKKNDSSEKFQKEMDKARNEVWNIYSKVTPDFKEYRKNWVFHNGFGIYVIRGLGTYGAEKNLFEIAVLKNNKLCYNTPITDDVIGFLTDEEVLEKGLMIALLEGKTIPKDIEEFIKEQLTLCRI
jgi:hypothetical protein